MIRVLIAEDQSLVRGAMAALLGLEPDLDVVADVSRGDEVVPAALAHRPDVAVLDIELPGLDGLAAAAQLRTAVPSTRVLIVTTFGRPGYLRRAFEASASGFLLKDAPASELAVAIRRAAAGDRVVDPALAAEALSEGASPCPSGSARSSPRRPAWQRWPRTPVAVRGDGAQPPVGRDTEGRCAEPRGSGADRAREGLARARTGAAVGAKGAWQEPARVAPRSRPKPVATAELRAQHVTGILTFPPMRFAARR